MAKLELLPNEVVVYESMVMHARRKWHFVGRKLTLTNQRFVVRVEGIDPISDGLSLRDLFGMLIGKPPIKGKAVQEVPFAELVAISRAKFGLNNNILVLETRGGGEHRFSVDDFETWFQQICEAIPSKGSLQIVAASPKRWLVQREPPR